VNNKPKHFIILKIVGVCGFIILIAGIVLLISGFDDFDNEWKFMTGMFMLPVGFMSGISCTIFGFGPEISKMRAKSAKYIQQENKEVLEDIATTSAEINSDAVTITTKAVKAGLKDTIFCKYCGEEIDEDSQFCKHCGKNLN
jgi:hypothetical protein